MDEPITGTLLCTLLDRRSSVPLADARITCVVAGTRIVQIDTDARGAFRADFPQGVYDLIISTRGELSLMLRGIGILGGHEQHMQRALTPGVEAEDLKTPASALGGYITDRLNHAVINVAVTLTPVHGGRTYTTNSDRVGAYIVHHLDPGEYDLVVRSGARTLLAERVDVPDHREFVRRDFRVVAL